ncbi:hypothetical protein ACFQHW_01040 [Lapidilactobacillus achengensis]|uniref:Uncharacterized protein n=1 Tax=Lapidilactobacillus achengensis TaxID=2486000 RepID=A0ABW1UMW7_9LACO|nr:hypothetical protein [Lapidilactobacillus achengensis]
MTSDYSQQLQALVNGEISSLTVTEKDFMNFRKAWLEFPQRKEIVGEAKRNGTVIYRFDESGNVQ